MMFLLFYVRAILYIGEIQICNTKNKTIMKRQFMPSTISTVRLHNKLLSDSDGDDELFQLLLSRAPTDISL